MKRKLSVFCLVLVCILVFTGCCFHREWYAASCTDPKTCVECGETEGEALGHTWTDATCTAPKTCSACRLTEGEALGHVWVEATTEAPKTCSTCSETEGERIITDERFTTAATAAIHGKWSSEISMTGDMLGVEGFESTLSIQILMEFGNDGSMTMGYTTVNNEEFSKGMYDFMVNALYSDFAAEGIDQESANAGMVEAYGMTVEEYAEAFTAEMDFSAVFEALDINGVYYVEGDQLYTGISWDMEMGASAFTIEGDTLTLAEELSGLVEESLVFTRITE